MVSSRPRSLMFFPSQEWLVDSWYLYCPLHIASTEPTKRTPIFRNLSGPRRRMGTGPGSAGVPRRIDLISLTSAFGIARQSLGVPELTRLGQSVSRSTSEPGRTPDAPQDDRFGFNRPGLLFLLPCLPVAPFLSVALSPLGRWPATATCRLTTASTAPSFMVSKTMAIHARPDRAFQSILSHPSRSRGPCMPSTASTVRTSATLRPELLTVKIETRRHIGMRHPTPRFCYPS